MIAPVTARVFFTQIPARTYGRYAVRFKAVSVTPGWSASIGLVPADGVLPDHGEIEVTGVLSDDALIVYTPASPTGVPAGVSTGVQWASGWHIAVIEWRATSVKAFMDGTQVYSTTSNIPSTPMVFSINTTGDSATDAHLQIDWVAAWST